MADNVPWQLRVIGPPRLVDAGGTARPCTGRTAALLAYLALEGPTDRATVTRLLWPGTPDQAARNNLVHLLRRLRARCGEDLVTGGATLTLRSDVQCDARDVLQGRPNADAVEEHSEFLAGLDLDDCLDLTEWLAVTRARVINANADAAGNEIAKLEQRGQYAEALHLAMHWLRADPLSEETYRHLMRLHALNGDRPAALHAYRRLSSALERELGVKPTPETARLARAIDEGTFERPARPRIPVTVLRPPTLVGRDDLWEQMEDAWARGLGIMLIGDAGSGKTRLAVDFLRSKTTHRLLLFEGRPGDQASAYTTHARTYRQVLEAYPDLELPGWARRELARVLPSLGDPPPPMLSDADKLRFYDAKVEVIRLVVERGPVILASDDVQFMDDASIEAGAYVFSRFWGDAQTNLRTLFCHRTGTMSAVAAGIMEQMFTSGAVIPLHLRPLHEQDVQVLLKDLHVPDAAALSGSVNGFARGNPQFVLEVVRNMYETDGFTNMADHHAHDHAGLTPMIERRLERLSLAALNAARAAAVLRSDFTIEEVAQTLNVSILDALTAWEELEAAQVVQHERFSHDLVLEAVVRSTPDRARRLLQRAAARTLAQQNANPARIAQLWLDGEDPAQAGPWLLRAARRAEENLQPDEAVRFYLTAAQAFEQCGNADQQQLAVQQRDRVVRAAATRVTLQHSPEPKAGGGTDLTARNGN